MAVMVTDPIIEQKLRDEWSANDTRREEVWEGMLVMPPLANNEHQLFVMKLAHVFCGLIDWDRGDLVLPGANVSDRVQNWTFNYRIPDVVVYREGGNARNYDTHLVGGPDLLVEIASPGEDPEAKLDFYSKIAVQELLVVEREPWALELYQLRKSRLASVGRSDVTTSTVLTSGVLPLSFRLLPGTARPVMEVVHTTTGERWTV